MKKYLILLLLFTTILALNAQTNCQECRSSITHPYYTEGFNIKSLRSINDEYFLAITTQNKRLLILKNTPTYDKIKNGVDNGNVVGVNGILFKNVHYFSTTDRLSLIHI